MVKEAIDAITKISEMKETTEIKKADQLKNETDNLKTEVKKSVKKFLDEVGDCGITITVEQEYYRYIDGKEKLVNVDVDVKVTV